MNINTFFKLLIPASLLVLSTSASAFLITGVNDPTNNTADVTVSGTTISILNTSNYAGTITGFGFDADNTLLSLSSVTGTRDNSAWTYLTDQTVGGAGGGSFEFALATGSNLTGGSPNDGIAPSATGVFTFNLNLLNVTDFFVRFQRTGADGDGSDRGRLCQGTACEPTQVSEPGTLALMALGLLSLGSIRRKS